MLRHALTIFIGLFWNTGFAGNTCLKDDLVQQIVANSADLDECFDDDVNDCLIGKMSSEEQRKLNSKRLIPVDRSSSRLMNNATGAVSVHFPDEVQAATGEKISRCHIITSAHLLYESTKISVDSNDLPSKAEQQKLKIRFHSGQTCDNKLFDSSAESQLYFKMTKQGLDFICDKKDNADFCLERRFFGKSDLVILKLLEYNRADRTYFRLITDPLRIPLAGQRVDCWGYPEYNNQIKLPKALSDQVLWYQKSAKIFWGNYDRGTLTNAIAYPGMSGGGCALQSSPDQLVGIFAAKNSATGHSAILITAQNADKMSANFISPFQTLSERYSAATGKSLERLDEECD